MFGAMCCWGSFDFLLVYLHLLLICCNFAPRNISLKNVYRKGLATPLVYGIGLCLLGTDGSVCQGCHAFRFYRIGYCIVPSSRRGDMFLVDLDCFDALR